MIGVARVQKIVRVDGRRAYTVVDADGRIFEVADGFLRGCSTGTARTYAYRLVDHLRWLESEGLCPEIARMEDLKCYLGALGVRVDGQPDRTWRLGKPALRQSTLATTAAVLKGFYAYQGSRGINQTLARSLDVSRLPTKVDRSRQMLGHIAREVDINPLQPKQQYRIRHPKLPPADARSILLQEISCIRDRMTIIWLGDGGFRIGELTGLHLIDLHLRQDADCGECSTPHVHICHRDNNPNEAAAKSKVEWWLDRGVVHGGLIRRASPAMISSYFEYMTTEYPAAADHGMLFVVRHGPTSGQPWSADMARRMLRRAGNRLNLGKLNPHQFRHEFATEVLAAADGNTVIARDAGGWASATTVDQVYGHVDLHDGKFILALEAVWRRGQ